VCSLEVLFGVAIPSASRSGRIASTIIRSSSSAPTRGRKLVPDALARNLPLELGKGQENSRPIEVVVLNFWVTDTNETPWLSLQCLLADIAKNLIDADRIAAMAEEAHTRQSGLRNPVASLPAAGTDCG
jgi:hypothetical protein